MVVKVIHQSPTSTHRKPRITLVTGRQFGLFRFSHTTETNNAAIQTKIPRVCQAVDNSPGAPVVLPSPFYADLKPPSISQPAHIKPSINNKQSKHSHTTVLSLRKPRVGSGA